MKRKGYLSYCLLIFVLWGITFSVMANQKRLDSLTSVPDRKIRELVGRNGLPNFFRKVKAGQAVRVSYLGGSITAQAGWRVQSFDYLCKRFPNAKIVEQDASMGGTTSQLGVLRLDHDVLQLKPDLLFVEFAVNDFKTDPIVIVRSMEGIVRKTWSKYPDCDICFVYTLTEATNLATPEGFLPKSASTMELVADRYGIPSIFFGTEVLALFKSGKLVWKTPKGMMTKVSGKDLDSAFQPQAESDGKIYFSPDGTHPYLNTGHVFYTNALKRSFSSMEKFKSKVKNHRVPKPLRKDNYQKSSSINLDKAEKSNQWELLDKNNERYLPYSNRFDKLWRVGEGGEIHFSFQGESLITYDLMGPQGCSLEITVDGKKSVVNRFDGYCTYWRMHSFPIVSGLNPTKIHQVTIKVTSKDLDKKSILFEQNRSDFEGNPNKYKPVYWYVSTLFVL